MNGVQQLGKLAVGFGILLLAHSAFSAAQYRRSVAAFEQEDAAPDMAFDITFECLLAFLVVCCGFVLMSADLKPIKGSVMYSSLTFEQQNLRADFMTFNHRGRVLEELKKAT
eukprot:TRINITY_DN12073_c0_g1_i1.p1 TRINITY_DN12073_c0_g1~~TRINITY_DN12073_c0_g1_i1.p1  ORF type:complete len:112 (+),score=17.26 TRINITY_DN12073_c0_g1_i1:122-457(+)